MSSTVKSKGFIAILKNPVDEADKEDVSERLYDSKCGLDITYDGKMVFSDVYRHASFDVREDVYICEVGVGKEESADQFVKIAAENGLEINENSIEPYFCIWYNGSDCPISELTPETYLS